ncbi:Membrane associated serine protease, rhomboid family [Lutibacter agarilyticus]|uniref:Membrane associated serine protease, rhomboid family n=1 Tax=Lutibacter agarilyticus TaxID=1109740 RepID=A0A238YPI0_9FLAO|nr:rhomboid family intramembrane serine protease [Lutibacter agarilyticus]SNR72902.1 Membrane associated serine protease, rhomboid family [Lutibacter agarilyticus]
MNIDTSVLFIIITNVLISIKGFSDRSFFDKYKFQIGAIKRGEKIRIVSSAFLHVDYLHLILNMYVLYIFAPQLIQNLGVIKFLIIYVGSLFTGSLFTLSFHKNELYYSAVGASGAVAGVIYAAILLNPNMRLIMFPLPIPIPAYIFGVGYLLYSIYGMKNKLGNVGHSAHLGGAIGGYGLTLLVSPNIFMQSTVTVVLLGIPIILLLLFGNKLK